MRIGLDARTSEGETGVAQYGKNIVAALKLIGQGDEFVVFNKEKQRIPFWTAHMSARWKFNRAKLNILHVLGGTAPLTYRQPYILTVHDLAIYKHPEWFPKGQWFSTRISFPLTVKKARHIIVPSEATKKDLINLMKVDAKKITIIPHGVSAPPLLNKDRGGVRRIQFLGTIEPRKNILTLVRAYRRLVDSHRELSDVELCLAGQIGWRTNEIMDEIGKTQHEGYKVIVLGSVSENKKWKLLSKASCFVSPSHYEGFGLPVLEAMAAGTPVVCSNSSSHPEVAGGAALMVDSNDVEGFTFNISQVLMNQKTADDLRVKGLARASGFSWEETARRTLEVYNKFSV